MLHTVDDINMEIFSVGQLRNLEEVKKFFETSTYIQKN